MCSCWLLCDVLLWYDDILLFAAPILHTLLWRPTPWFIPTPYLCTCYWCSFIVHHCYIIDVLNSAVVFRYLWLPRRTFCRYAYDYSLHFILLHAWWPTHCPLPDLVGVFYVVTVRSWFALLLLFTSYVYPIVFPLRFTTHARCVTDLHTYVPVPLFLLFVLWYLCWCCGMTFVHLTIWKWKATLYTLHYAAHTTHTYTFCIIYWYYYFVGRCAFWSICDDDYIDFTFVDDPRYTFLLHCTLFTPPFLCVVLLVRCAFWLPRYLLIRTLTHLFTLHCYSNYTFIPTRALWWWWCSLLTIVTLCMGGDVCCYWWWCVPGVVVVDPHTTHWSRWRYCCVFIHLRSTPTRFTPDVCCVTFVQLEFTVVVVWWVVFVDDVIVVSVEVRSDVDYWRWLRT